MPDYTESTELKGVAGWLLLFVIILAVISPIRILIETGTILEIPSYVATQLGTRWKIYEAFTWVTSIVTIAAMFYFAYRLVKVQTRSTVRLVIRGIWVLAIAPLILDFIVAGILWPDNIAQGFDAAYFKAVFQSLFFATIWSLYLAKSRRVANTYVDGTSDAERIFG